MFTASGFLDLGSRDAVDKALSRQLRHLGQRHVDDRALMILRQRLTAADKRQLLKDLHYAPAWIARLIREVAESPEK